MYLNLNTGNQFIDVTSLKQSLPRSYIAPADQTYEATLAPEHTSEPIKSMNDIMNISSYLIQNERFRDNMLFIVGINFGLRVSDLRVLRFSNLINDNLTFKENFPVFEKKTRNTRKRKRNRYITINKAVIEAVTLYLENTSGVKLSDYMFKGEGNRSVNSQEPLSSNQIDRILKGIANDLKLNAKISTHSLRKTFAYHQMVMSNNDPRKLLLLQKMLGHSTSAQTLDYIGITGEEIEQAYKELNLGSIRYNYLVDVSIIENDSYVS